MAHLQRRPQIVAIAHSAGTFDVILCSIISSIFRQIARIPISLALAVLAVVVAAVPSAGGALQFSRLEIMSGEFWRLATCHLTHWNSEHLQWDLLMFVVLGALCEVRDRRRMVYCLIMSAAAVSLLVLCMFPGISQYRGLSGIDTALFMLLAIDLIRDARRQENWILATIAVGLFFGFIAKCVYEALTLQPLFVDQRAAEFDLLVWDHIVAAAIGGGLAFRHVVCRFRLGSFTSAIRQQAKTGISRCRPQ
jgi:rhomboid family GlyGly-CTERM serine protease